MYSLGKWFTITTGYNLLANNYKLQYTSSSSSSSSSSSKKKLNRMIGFAKSIFKARIPPILMARPSEHFLLWQAVNF